MAASFTTIRPTPNKKMYRIGVMCRHCRKAQEFVYNAPYWSCIVCGTEELESNGDPSPSPWLFLHIDKYYGASLAELLERREIVCNNQSIDVVVMEPDSLNKGD